MKGRKRHWLADWRQVRVWETDTRHALRGRHVLWLHGWCIGLVVLAIMWGASHAQMLLGSESLAGRYVVTLGIGYLAFLAVLRIWAGWLVGEEADWGAAGVADVVDVAADAGNLAVDAARAVARSFPDAAPRAGGGDFAGGGADASFEVAADTGSAAGDLASGALDVAGGADEGAIVVVPVLAVFVAGCLVLFGAGSLLLLYFGSEVLLAVAVEIAFGYASARTAIRVVREGWIDAAVRLTWKPLLGTLVCAVALGALVDHFVPQARSLPHAIELIQAR